MRKISDKEIESVLKIDGRERFNYLVKRIADEERAWGLWRDGWALMEDIDGVSVFPLWPAYEYAQRCAAGDWAGYLPSEISLGNLLDELAPKLAARGIHLGVFPTPSGKGVRIGSGEFCRALRNELQNYE